VHMRKHAQPHHPTSLCNTNAAQGLCIHGRVLVDCSGDEGVFAALRALRCARTMLQVGLRVLDVQRAAACAVGFRPAGVRVHSVQAGTCVLAARRKQHACTQVPPFTPSQAWCRRPPQAM